MNANNLKSNPFKPTDSDVEEDIIKNNLLDQSNQGGKFVITD